MDSSDNYRDKCGLAVYLGFPLLALVVDPEMVVLSRALLPILFVGLMVYAAFIPSDAQSPSP